MKSGKHPLHRVRVRAGLGRAEAAKRLRCSRQHLWAVEKFKSPCSGKIALRASEEFPTEMRALKLGLADLIRGG